jgi:hypothetical protein
LNSNEEQTWKGLTPDNVAQFASDSNDSDCSGENPTTDKLFEGDCSTLPLDTRRALMQLLSGPFISASKHSKIWAAMLRDEPILRSRLSELFLDIVVDREQQVAFIRQAQVNGIEVPTLLRRSQLTFIDSALILDLRKKLAHADARNERAVVSEQELVDALLVFERVASTDRAGFQKRVSASIVKMKKNNILHLIRNTKDRFEISPTLKLLFSAAEIKALTEIYLQMAAAEQSSKLRQDDFAQDTSNGQESDDEQD